MYIGGKYQCHGNEPLPLPVFLLVVGRSLLIVVTTGMSDGGEGTGIKLNKQRSNSATGSSERTHIYFLFIC